MTLGTERIQTLEQVRVFVGGSGPRHTLGLDYAQFTPRLTSKFDLELLPLRLLFESFHSLATLPPPPDQ